MRRIPFKFCLESAKELSILGAKSYAVGLWIYFLHNYQ